MRVSDDRYDRDRLRFDLALRMVRHGARTRTICGWTGLTDDRLRKLCRAYPVPRCPRRNHRLRAKLPHHASCFLRSSMLGFEASTLGSLYYLLGLIPADARPDGGVVTLHTLRRCETFCDAYEIYLSLYPPARLSFDQAWFLLGALARREGIKLTPCGRCGRLYLTDTACIDFARCGCGSRRLNLPRRRRLHRRAGRASTTPPSRRDPAASQQAVLDE